MLLCFKASHSSSHKNLVKAVKLPVKARSLLILVPLVLLLLFVCLFVCGHDAGSHECRKQEISAQILARKGKVLDVYKDERVSCRLSLFLSSYTSLFKWYYVDHGWQVLCPVRRSLSHSQVPARPCACHPLHLLRMGGQMH